jgi:hypothetical protein
MRQLLFWSEIVLFALTCLTIFAGQRLGMPPLTFLGVLFLGVLAIVLGVDVIVRREASFRTRRAGLVTGSQQYSGVAAQIWGIFFVLAGIGCILAAVTALLMPDRAQEFIDRAFETSLGWGLLATIIGVFLSLYGLSRLLAGGAATVSNLSGRMRDAGYRLFGGACLIIGVGLVALGLTLAFSPETLDAFISRWLPQSP